MRTIAVVCMMLLVGASGAGAADIKGKWGIGAGVFGGGGEVSLIRGKSERSAWLFDVFSTQRYESAELEVIPPVPTSDQTRRSFSIVAGPGYRRFTRPTEEFSPYWDVRARATYGRTSTSSGVGDLRTDVGLRGDLSIGLEYFTRWHFSVAAHTGIAQLGWVRSVTRQTGTVQELKVTQNSETLSLGLSPALFIRGYF